MELLDVTCTAPTGATGKWAAHDEGTGSKHSWKVTCDY
jgi:hypothetical protein